MNFYYHILSLSALPVSDFPSSTTCKKSLFKGAIRRKLPTPSIQQSSQQTTPIIPYCHGTAHTFFVLPPLLRKLSLTSFSRCTPAAASKGTQQTQSRRVPLTAPRSVVRSLPLPSNPTSSCVLFHKGRVSTTLEMPSPKGGIRGPQDSWGIELRDRSPIFTTWICFNYPIPPCVSLHTVVELTIHHQGLLRTDSKNFDGQSSAN